MNGNEISPNRQGFNFAVIDLKTGKLEDTEAFNTHGIAGAYRKMDTFIDGLPDWKIIVASIKEDGKDNLPSSSLAKFVGFAFTFCLNICILVLLHYYSCDFSIYEFFYFQESTSWHKGSIKSLCFKLNYYS